MRNEDAPAFEAVLQDLCLAFNRPYTPELTRVFWDALKHSHIHDIRRVAIKVRNTAKKFPTPKELTPERAAAPPPPKPEDDGPAMSPWAIAANKILWSVAYQGHRGFQPMAEKLKPCLAVKADYVQMAEQAQAKGDTWNSEEFNRACRESFEKVLTA